VRMPALRAFAKNLAREIDEFSDVKNLLNLIDDKIFEEVLTAGLVIFYAQNLTVDEKISLTKIYLAKVDSWGQIDTFVQNFAKEKFAKNNDLGPLNKSEDDKLIREKYWDFALENLRSNEEFLVRYGAMVMFENFLNDEKIREVLAAFREIKCDKYYAKMAVAWTYEKAAESFYNLILREMSDAKIDAWTRRKALTKMLESRKFSAAQKVEIRELRGKIKGEK